MSLQSTKWNGLGSMEYDQTAPAEKNDVGTMNMEFVENGMQLLVIDDEEAVREAVVDILEMIGVDVIEACNGQVGVDLYTAHRDKIGAVLLDMQMPIMNGEETFHALRAFDPNIKVIVSSGYSETETMQHFVGQGLAAFLQKPYDIDTLINKVKSVLDA